MMLLVLASCKKEQAGPNDTRSPDPGATTYPTVDERELKGIVRTRFDSPNPTESQLARQARNNKLIQELGLPVLNSLPVIEDEESVTLRSPQEVAQRCLATTLTAIKGETQDQALVDSLVKDYSAASLFSPEETRFIASSAPPKQDLIDFCWRYECVHVFLWALGARDSLAGANEICPVPDDMKAIKRVGPTNFVAKAALRPKREILDMADLYYRLHWAAIELRIKGRKSDKADEGVIRERHRALNWLIRYMNQDWDDVTTDT